jgi:hypothetical protein
MSSCNHTSWLSFHKQELITLRQTSALHDIVATLDMPAEKYPSLVVLTGDVDGSGRLCDSIPRSRKQPDLECHTGLQLQLDHDTAFTEYPMLVAHGCNVNPYVPGRTVCWDTFSFGGSGSSHYTSKLKVLACIDCVTLSLLPNQTPVTLTVMLTVLSLVVLVPSTESCLTPPCQFVTSRLHETLGGPEEKPR